MDVFQLISVCSRLSLQFSERGPQRLGQGLCKQQTMSGSTAQPMLTCQRAPCGLADDWIRLVGEDRCRVHAANLTWQTWQWKIKRRSIQ